MKKNLRRGKKSARFPEPPAPQSRRRSRGKVRPPSPGGVRSVPRGTAPFAGSRPVKKGKGSRQTKNRK